MNILRRYSLFFAAALLLTFFAALPVWAAGEGTALNNGGNRLVATQGTDGGWGWPLTAPPTYNNTLGPIGMGLAKAFTNSKDANMLAALQKAGSKLLAKTNNFSPPDGYLAVALDNVFGGVKYRTYVLDNFYDKLAAGTYNRNGAGTLYTTASYVALVYSQRASGGQPNLAAWDLGMGLVAAASIGASTTEWINGVETAVNGLSYSNADAYWEPIGLAGAVYGLAFTGVSIDPTTGDYASAANTSDLANALAGYAITGSGFSWDAQNVIAGNEDVQLTAYAMLALNEFSRGTYKTKLNNALNYLLGDQLATGGWDSYEENNETTGEALWAISAYSLLGQAGIGAEGPEGPQGPAGPQGIQGIPGNQGIQGIPGNQGIQGIPGNQGIQGIPGSAGTTSWTDGTGIVTTGQKVGVGDYVTASRIPRNLNLVGADAVARVWRVHDTSAPALEFIYSQPGAPDTQLGYWDLYVTPSSDSKLIIRDRKQGNLNRLTVDASGNVGIGTVTPTQKLDVAGNVSFGGGSANHAICWKSDGKTLGYCSTVVASDGSCTCN